jgi:membrane protein
LITFLFGLMFKVLPDAQTKWKSIWIGSMLTSFLFILGKYALGLYFGKFQPASAYGAAGSVILILLWVSYSCMILFFGAEFTKQHAVKTEGTLEPKQNAVVAKGKQNPPVD